MEELNYRPDLIARSLVSNSRIPIIGLVVSDICWKGKIGVRSMMSVEKLTTNITESVKNTIIKQNIIIDLNSSCCSLDDLIIKIIYNYKSIV